MLVRIASRIAMISSPLSDRSDYGHSESSLPRGESKVSYVRKTKNKEQWCVYSENNPEWSGGCYPSKTQAEERLQQVEMFKRMKSKKRKSK